ncbi:zinc finger HIT domain-containing protein 2 isoform X1 [Amborella trichopoda]|uniref:zinc finger HIT domain-containing protein 2 isoform X1 n=1 Tax=Amborella trichopoda TaxID=13333 RepID=UPI0005D42175|nr:zinc finger HIT domain-containing protein 2 isoform X1 [Amborella trichopoda]XP_020531389.1 zinc finger HIT domain-containing protein 2 isoform X1 [Amborella trichopoda]XP_020531390.1 zinc finger HIT domain-containing protein 2 isoform X1 [Amborella trichopoda]XP_020531391.1 zinc finger HIT domain-containing protein 2 isoform X1 [Amborella trichopoda]XP_020531392.1 zinc finger HIT domain-containing protein 2 isoform X1 [Amborella trichopoda]XP_020531393.1 zinc finger HIT domain-containing p|eukprot:XP_011628335.1 zinc finger HIT domain-containing protein 2 isoform X1 [Amborella trichopoda]
MGTEARIICRVCQKQFSQYTCPRCNSRYCSLPCYKRHGLHCTESFMRENVMEELHQIQPEDETKQKMLDILKRFHLEEQETPSETCNDEEDDSLLSEETIQKILFGNHVNFSDLSEEEMKRFQRAVASGELSNVIEPWTPWWLNPSAKSLSLSHKGTRLVQPLHKENPPQGNPDSPFSDVPPGPEAPMAPLSQLTKTEPSPLLAVHLVDVIYSYCFTLRLYNGDWQSDPLGASMVLLSISSVLGEGHRPETVSEALALCLEKTCSPLYKHVGGLTFGLILFEDAKSLLSLGGAVLVCMLNDLQRLMEEGVRELKGENIGIGKKSRGSGRKLRAASKKAYFLMCWVHEQGMGRKAWSWSSLAGLVGVERAALAHTNVEDKFANVKGKEACKAKAIIEEVK